MSYTEVLSTAAPYRKIIQQVEGGIYDLSNSAFAISGLRSGVKVENYKDKIAAGSQAGSAYSIDVYDAWNHEGNYKVRFAYQGKWVVQTFTGVEYPAESFSHLVSTPAQVGSDALAKVLSKIRQTHSEMNGLVILGEMRETLRMLRRPAHSLVEGISSYITHLNNQKVRVSKMSVKRRRDAWGKAISGSWLEATYGWIPLFSDIRDICKVLERISKRGPSQVRVSGTARLTNSDVWSNAKHYVHTPSRMHLYSSMSQVTETESSVRYLAGLDVEAIINKGSLSRVLDLSGVTLENFVPALYELMPWSFLIDYFSNLGKVIEGWTTDTSSVRWAIRTDRQRSSRVKTTVTEDPTSNILAAGGAGVTYAGGFGHSVTVRTSLNRTLVNDLGVPKFYLTHPGDSPKKLFNIIALLEQARVSSRDLKWLSRIG